MKHLLLLSVICFFFINETASQSRSQIRLKYGYARPLVTPGVKDGYAYRVRDGKFWSAGIAIEYYTPVKGKSTCWFVGISIDPQAVRIELNPENFQAIISNYGKTESNSTQRAYLGWGKNISKTKSKSHFIVFGGLGIAFAPQLGGGFIKPGSEGITKNGEQFKSPYKNWVIDSGYVTDVTAHEPFILSPTVHVGIRWQLRNKKGNDVIGLELMGNHGITRYFRYIVSYTLDGTPKQDKFAEKGFCYQLNLLIPLKNFGKKKKEHE